MQVIRWSPSSATSRDYLGFQDEINRLFDSLTGRSPSRFGDSTAGFAPSVDIEETPEEFVLRADLPGVQQKDVKVSLMGDTLTVRGERRQHSNTHLHRAERAHGQFERSFSLGTPVRGDKVQATFKDGVLEVHVPKAEEARLKEIEVQVG